MVDVLVFLFIDFSFARGNFDSESNRGVAKIVKPITLLYYFVSCISKQSFFA